MERESNKYILKDCLNFVFAEVKKSNIFNDIFLFLFIGHKRL